MKKVTVKQVVVLEPMEQIQWGRSTMQPMEDSMTGSGSALKKAGAHGESPGAGSWQKLQPVERSLH